MEKYLSLIILAAPGFIAERIATALGVTSPKIVLKEEKKSPLVLSIR